ncbi:unnamed protein product [Dicrocoelium dendriticum]|nr:unnamed protein product [Dicrocoelium dendriticum]
MAATASGATTGPPVESNQIEASCSNTPEPIIANYQCGLLRWRPSCLKRAANIHAFLAAACFISCLQAAHSGYYASQVTTLEKRFAVGSSVIGAVNSFFEIGYIISVVFVSYAGSRGHVPAWISLGLFIMGVGGFLWALPHFIFPHSSAGAFYSLDPLCSVSSSADNSTSCAQQQSSGFAFLIIFFVAQLLIGSGSSPILTLAPPFIDDHVHPSRAPPMIASQYAAAAMGPVLGFALGASVLQYPAELFSHTDLTPDNPNWIGAWWLGFFILGGLVFMGSLLLLCFPRKLREISKRPRKSPLITSPATEVQLNGSALPDGVSHTSSFPPPSVSRDAAIPGISATDVAVYSSSASNSGRCYRSRPCSRSRRSPHTCASPFRRRLFDPSHKFTKFSQMVRSLVLNRVYVVVCLCICAEMFMIIGFASFLPKYLEMEYHISKSTASMIAGGLIVPSGAFGILVGGLILNRFHFRRRGAIRFVLIINTVIIGCITSFFFLGCDNLRIAGVTVDYPSIGHFTTTRAPLPWWSTSLPVVKSSAACNSHCGCDSNFWSPVCDDVLEITFISPCFAGCTNVSVNPKVYRNCECAEVHRNMSGITHLTTATLKPGECPTSCSRLLYFIIVLTTCLFLTGVIQNPLLMVTMRSVDRQERSFALGVQFVILRLLANLPSPMVFGRVIDAACRLWRVDCDRTGDCAYVDVRKLNHYMTGLGLIIKGSGFFFYFLLLYLLRSSSSRESDNGTSIVRLSRQSRKPSEPLSGPRSTG